MMRWMRFCFLAAALAAVGLREHRQRATGQFTDNLTTGILNEDDIVTVHDGVPAYLMLIDGIIEGDPQNPSTLLAGAKLYGAYAGGFVGDPVRAQRMAERAYTYARRALCVREKKLCDALQGRSISSRVRSISPTARTSRRSTVSRRRGPDASRSTPATGTRSPTCRSCRRC